MTDTALHPFDRAVALQPVPGQPNLYEGHTSQDYWNMVGPFGGVTAALLLQSALRHPQLLGTPVSLTVNYAAAVVVGAFQVEAVPVRTNRSTQHWLLRLTQADESGEQRVTTTGTLVTALRRDTWCLTDIPAPELAPPGDFAPMSLDAKGVAWPQQYEMRAVSGAFPTKWDGGGETSRSQLWLRDAQVRPLDFLSLAAMSDIFYPRIWLRRATPVPAGTVSITTYFHTDAAQMAEVGSDYLLGDARAQEFRNGFFDQSAQLWSQSGALLASSNQIVYYKE